MAKDIQKNTSLVDELMRQYGEPDFKVDQYGEGKSFKQGARCSLNLNCRRVNTAGCNINACQGGVKRVAYEIYDSTSDNPFPGY